MECGDFFPKLGSKRLEVIWEIVKSRQDESENMAAYFLHHLKISSARDEVAKSTWILMNFSTLLQFSLKVFLRSLSREKNEPRFLYSTYRNVPICLIVHAITDDVLTRKFFFLSLKKSRLIRYNVSLRPFIPHLPSSTLSEFLTEWHKSCEKSPRHLPWQNVKKYRKLAPRNEWSVEKVHYRKWKFPLL